MKRKLLSFIFVFTFLSLFFVNIYADNQDIELGYMANIETSKEDVFDKQYTVPVSLESLNGGSLNFSDSLVAYAKINKNGDKYTYYLTFIPIEKNFDGELLEAELTNLFYYDESKKQASYHDLGSWSFTLNEVKDKVKVNLWVETITDESKSFAKDVNLVFDLSSVDIAKASESSTKKDKEKDDKQDKKDQEKIDKKKKDEAEQKKKQENQAKKDQEEKLQQEEARKKQEEKEREELARNRTKKISIQVISNELSYNKFVDVNQNSWFANSVSYVLQRGIMNGLTSSTFNPKDKASRSMITTMLYRLESKPYVEYANSFSDVPASKWYTDGIIWSSKNNIVNGYGDGKFLPKTNLTREQFATILYRYSKFKNFDTPANISLANFSDQANISSYAIEPFVWAVQNSLITGTSPTTLSPKKEITRAEIATILERYIEKYVN